MQENGLFISNKTKQTNKKLTRTRKQAGNQAWQGWTGQGRHDTCNGNMSTKHNTCGQKSARPSKLKTTRSQNKTENGARVSESRYETET